MHTAVHGIYKRQPWNLLSLLRWPSPCPEALIASEMSWVKGNFHIHLLPILLLLCPSWRPDQIWIYQNAAHLSFCICTFFRILDKIIFKIFDNHPCFDLWYTLKNKFYITSNGTRHQWGVSLTTTISPKWEAEDTPQSIANKGHILRRVTAGIPVSVLFWKLVWWEHLCCCQHRLLLLRLGKKNQTKN